MATETAIKKREGDTARVEHMRDRWTYTPSVDILETADEFLVVADMPGVKAPDVEVQYEQGVLTIHGTVEPRQNEDNTHYLLREYGVGDYHRVFRIGEGIDAEKIQAELHEGVMQLHLPKSEKAKPRKITVRSG